MRVCEELVPTNTKEVKEVIYLTFVYSAQINFKSFLIFCI